MNRAVDNPQAGNGLSTGLKMLLIIALALMPLGIIALISSIRSAEDAHESRVSEAKLIAQSSGDRLSSSIETTLVGLRVARAVTIADGADEERCARTLASFAALEPHGLRLSVFSGDGAQLCATDGFAPEMPAAEEVEGRHATLDASEGVVRFLVSGVNGNVFAIAEIPAGTLAALADPVETLENLELELVQDDARVRLYGERETPIDDHTHRIERPLIDGDLHFVASFDVRPLATSDMFSIAIPLLMWLAAALLGWFFVNRLVLKPLSRLEAAVAAQGDEQASFSLPGETRVAREINELGMAFDRTFRMLDDHKGELAEGLAEQTRLTREIHHRVKNNLQVIASLLNIHAREAKSEDAAAAYAGIQRRVGALAIVQRNLFAEQDARDGIALRPIVAELAAGLHRSAATAERLAIDVDVADVRVSQDTAVAVAFFVTEVVELALSAAEEGAVGMTVQKLAADRAKLEITSVRLEEASQSDRDRHYARILEGLARQLRSQLDIDAGNGRYAVEIAIL